MSAFAWMLLPGVRVTPSCHMAVVIAIFISSRALLGTFGRQTVLLASCAPVLTGAAGSYGI